MLGFLLGLANFAGATDYFVGGPNASDANSGTTLEAPFATLSKAAGILEAGDVCSVRGGIYRETLTPAKSGSAGAPILFQAYAGEKVTISGCDLVTGWVSHSGSIQKAPMAWSLGLNNQVFVNGAMMNEARWPSDTDGQVMTPNPFTIQAGDSVSITHASIPGATDAWKGASIWVLAGKKWTSWVVPVTGYNAATKTVSFHSPSSSWIHDNMDPSQGGSFYLVGSMAGLNTAAEWFHDPVQKTLYLIPPAGVNLSGATVEAKARKWAVNLSGKSAIVIRGIDVAGASVNMQNATGCTIDAMKARYIWHHRGEGATSFLPETNGFLISGTGNQLLNSDIGFGSSEGVSISGTGNLVQNCFIHDFSYLGNYGAPVRINGANTLSHCTVRNAGRDCIQFTGTMKIEYCEISHSGMINHDLGLVYKGRTDGEHIGTIAYNWIHDNVTSGRSSPCLYFDNFAKNYIVHHNVIWNCSGDAGIRINKPTEGHRIYNNTLFYSDDIGTHTYAAPADPAYGPFDNKFDGKNNLYLDSLPASQLVDVGAKNFMLKAGVSAIDKGMEIPGITEGFTGAKPDLGAYEFGGAAWTAGASSTVVTAIRSENAAGRDAPVFSALQISGRLVILADVREAAELALFTFQGRLVSRSIGKPGTRSLSVPVPAARMYLARLTVDGRTAVLKLMGFAP